MEQVHDIYSLRWQIEIVFKTWKSLFGINHCHNIKRERLECHLYGQLIAIFLCSSTMFKMRQLLLGVPSGKCGFTTLRKFNVKKPDSNSYGIRLS